MKFGHYHTTPYPELKAQVKSMSNDDLADAVLEIAYGSLKKELSSKERLVIEDAARRVRRSMPVINKDEIEQTEIDGAGKNVGVK